MKSSLKIWMVILAIIVLGGGITFITNSYVSSELEKMAATEYSALEEPMMEAGEDNRTAAAGAVRDAAPAEFSDETEQEKSETAAASVWEDGMLAEAETVREEEQKQTDKAADMDRESIGQMSDDAGMGRRMAVEEELTEEKTDAQAAMPKSTAKTTGKQVVEIAAEDSANLQERLAEYEQRLQELDVQIEAMRNSETDTHTINSVKTTAQTEMQIWEREMDGIYRIICDSLDDEELQALKEEQQEWIQLRNSRAEAAAKKNIGGTLERVDYIASAAASARERAYELIRKYRE